MSEPVVEGSLLVTVPEDRWADAMRPWPDGVEVRTWDLATPAATSVGDDPAARVQVVVLPYQRPDADFGHLAALPALRLVQTLTAGWDGLLDRIPSGVPLANATAVHDTSTAELALGLVLTSLRGLDDAARDLARHAWTPVVRTSLADRRVLLVGVGGVGEAVRARLAPFEVVTTRVASTARDDAHGLVHGVQELTELAAGHDVLVLACPLTDATRGLVDADLLAALPDGALVVNVARGPVVDTAALLAELTSGRLRAALDVVDPEPLPPDHPLWDAPGLVLTPHVGGASTAMVPRAGAMLRRQLRELLSGRPPRDVVGTGTAPC